MPPATFFKHFELLADQPDAVGNMRTLIFELAAEGRLLGPASTPVEKTHVGEFAEFVMGQAPAGNECNTNGEGTIFVKAGEFGPLYAEVKCWTTRPLKFAKRGDVLICVVGATVGKLNLAIDSAIGRSVAAIRPSKALRTKFLYYSLMPFVLRLRNSSRGSAQGVIGKDDLGKMMIRAGPLLYPPFLELMLNSPQITSIARRETTGGAAPRVNVSTVRAYPISFPPLAEQKRIVARVEELLRWCDTLEAQLHQTRTLGAHLLNSTLHHLLAA